MESVNQRCGSSVRGRSEALLSAVVTGQIGLVRPYAEGPQAYTEGPILYAEGLGEVRRPYSSLSVVICTRKVRIRHHSLLRERSTLYAEGPR